MPTSLNASLGYIPPSPKSPASRTQKPLRGAAHKHLERVINAPVASSSSIPTKYECVINSNRPDLDGFGSRTNRFAQRRHDIAGPGTYFKPEERDLLKQTPSLSKKGYGAVVSKDRRWYQSPGPTFNPPGPGVYDVEGSYKRTVEKRTTSYGVSPMFHKPSTKSLNAVNPPQRPLGPGAYVTENTPKYTDAYKYQESGIFKSKTQRGVKTPRKLDVHPSQTKPPYKMTTRSGDGNTAEEEEAAQRKRDKVLYRDTLLPSSVFRSGTRRDENPAPGVGPGYYNPPIPTEVHSTKRKIKSSSVFANTGKLDRFGNPMIRFARRMEVPAPGDYDIPSTFDSALTEHDGIAMDSRIAKSSVFMSKTKRFDESKAAKEVPAPGQYEGAQKGTLLRRSYNIHKTATWHP